MMMGEDESAGLAATGVFTTGGIRSCGGRFATRVCGPAVLAPEAERRVCACNQGGDTATREARPSSAWSIAWPGTLLL